MSATILDVSNLSVVFGKGSAAVPAVRGISFAVARGETLGIVGESGCGKTATGLALLGLLPSSGRVTSGVARLGNRDLLAMSPRELRGIRGRRLAMVFQDPATALNPVLSIGRQVSEAVAAHNSELDRAQAKKRALDLLEAVGVPDPAARYRDLPHVWSGGMRQRAVVAMAIANRPRLLIADEPTTALDVTIQAQVLDLLRLVQGETGAGLILISHDFGVVAEMSDRIAVMYAGEIVETGTAGKVMETPRHPYTAALLRSVPDLDLDREQLEVIGGQPPNPSLLPSGCPFRPRCFLSGGRAVCRETAPRLDGEKGSHQAACHFAAELAIR